MDGLDLQSRKLWLVASAFLALVIVAAAWFFAISPERTNTDDLRARTADTVLENSRLEAQRASLTRETKNLPVLRTRLTQALAALPAQPELPQLTTALTVTARRAGVKLTNITVTQAQAPTAAATPAPATTSASSSSSSSTTSTTTGGATTATAPTQLSIPVTLQITGSEKNDLAFLEAVRSGARSAILTSTQMSRVKNNFAATAQLEVFSAPMSSAQLANLQRLLKTGK